MNEELEVYSDTDKLKKSLENKRELLITEREKILGTRDASKANLEKLQNEVWEDLICLFCSVNLHMTFLLLMMKNHCSASLACFHLIPAADQMLCFSLLESELESESRIVLVDLNMIHRVNMQDVG